MILAVVPGVLVVLQYVLLAYVGRVGMLGLGTAGWVMAAMILIERTDRYTAIPNDTSGQPRLPHSPPLGQAA